MKNLNYCVNMVLVDLQDYASDQFQRILQYALMGFRDLQLFTMPNIKVAYLEPNDALIADLPQDYEYYTKIGVCIGGQIWTLSVNKDMCLVRETDGCGIDVPKTLGDISFTNAINTPTDSGGWGYYYSPHFRNGQYVGELYSMSGGLNELGYYKIDYAMNRIQFASMVPKTSIILEYKSNGADKGGDTVIPSAAVAPIRAYIHWQLGEFDKTVGVGEKERRRQMYYAEFEKFNFYNWIFTKDEYIDSTYQHIYSAVKR